MSTENNLEKLYAYSSARTALLECFDIRNQVILSVGELIPAIQKMLENNHCTLIKTVDQKNQPDIILFIEDILHENIDLLYEFAAHEGFSKIHENGIAIIATTNRLGMKYWAGCADEKTCMPFSGLESSSMKDRFTFQTLISFLHQYGFNNLQFYYPYPDHIFPEQIFSDDYLPSEGDLVTIGRAYLGQNYQLFEEKQALNTICKEGLFPEFSNSFLVFAKKETI